MEIIDLNESHHASYFLCLEDWSADIQEAGDHKARWFAKTQAQGLRVKLAVDNQGVVGGMIQYLPIENSYVQGQHLYFIHCIWVHGYQQGRGNFQKQGMGTALLAAAEADAAAHEARGIAAWGLILPFWMKARWFKKHGYRAVDRVGIQQLVWKPFTAAANPPQWMRELKRPQAVPGQVTVTAFINGWCPAQNLVFERAQRAAAELGPPVVFQPIDTSDRAVFLEWGIADGLFIDGKQIWSGPPPSFEKIKGRIARQVRKLKV